MPERGVAHLAANCEEDGKSPFPLQAASAATAKI
jgi:hypothetical protein